MAEPVSAAALNCQLIEIWKQQSHTALVPMLYPDPRPGSLLFIGINPSLGEHDVVRVLKGTEFEASVPSRAAVRPYFTFRPETIEEEVPDWQQIQLYHRQRLRYFKRHRELAQLAGLGDHWEQLDLFQVRESSQLNLVELVRNNAHDPFFDEQLRIFFDLLELMAPRIMVIVNRTTGDLLKERWLKKRLDETVLTPTAEPDVFTLSFRGQQIPVVFSVHLQYKPAAEREQINNRLTQIVRSAMDFSFNL